MDDGALFTLPDPPSAPAVRSYRRNQGVISVEKVVKKEQYMVIGCQAYVILKGPLQDKGIWSDLVTKKIYICLARLPSISRSEVRLLCLIIRCLQQGISWTTFT